MDALKRLILHQPVLYPHKQAQASETLILHDEFDGSGSLEDRTPVPLAPEGAAWLVDFGDFFLQDGAADINRGGDIALTCAAISLDTPNVRVSAVVTGDSGVGFAYGGSGIHVRCVDYETSYIVAYDTNTNTFGIGRVIAAVPSELASVSVTIDPAADHVIEAVCQGSTITATLDGAHQVVATGVDTVPTRVGLRLSSENTPGDRIKDFKVYALP